jgi:hypothetical protein
MSHQLNDSRRPVAASVALVVLVTVSAVVTSVLIGVAVTAASDDGDASDTFARAAGITAYLLLVVLVLTGLVLSHPAGARWTRPSVAVRIRTHVSLAVFTLVFTVLHVVMWATDADDDVGWWGALVPMGSGFRPLHVSLGVIGLYAGLAAGVTAAFAGRVAGRVWWPVHKVAIVSLMLVWVHTLGGLDAPVLFGLYVATGLAVIALALSRYLSKHRLDEVVDLAAVRATEVVPPRSH